MIVNIPTHSDYEYVSKQCLTQSFNLLYKVYEDYQNISDNPLYEGIGLEEIWTYNSGTIRTSLILLNQGIETYMKAVICKESPYLLLEKNRTDWPTLPSRANKEFDSFYTISGEALLATFCAVSETKLSLDFVEFIETVRRERNKVMHGANAAPLDVKELLGHILKAFTDFFGVDSWHIALRDYNWNNPLFGRFDFGLEDAMLIKYLDFALLVLGKKNIKKHLSVDISGRSYCCLDCKNTLDSIFITNNSKWAFLVPNKPDSKKIYCINCQGEFDVIRKKCTDNSCKGNVMYCRDGEIICLTCMNATYVD